MLKNTDGQAMLLSEYVLDQKQFMSHQKSTSWEGSELYAWLNQDFYQSASTADEQSAVLETETLNYDTSPNNPSLGKFRVNSRVFLLSYKEADTLLKGDTGRRAQPTNYARAKTDPYYLGVDGSMRYFLRTHGSSGKYKMIVHAKGHIYTSGVLVDEKHVGVRPAIVVDVEALRFLLTSAGTAPITASPQNEDSTPVTQPPVTQVPATQPPATQAPVTQPPATPEPTAAPVLQPIAGVTDAYLNPAIKSTANSYLISTNSDYSGAMVTDSDETTCWEFSTKEVKLGDAMLEIELLPGSTVDELWIKNGFWRITNGLDQYTRNCRPKEIGISFRYDGVGGFGDEIRLTLRDDKERKNWQVLKLGRHENVSAVKLRVISIYKRTKFKTDVAISEIMLVEHEGSAAIQYETLKRGSKGDDVLTMKLRMQELGYFKKNAELSNIYNDICVSRVKQFQKRNGLKQTGIADQETFELLYSDMALPSN